jgi:hypothetical protein
VGSERTGMVSLMCISRSNKLEHKMVEIKFEKIVERNV